MAEGLPDYLYHYTSEEGLAGILSSKRIKSSKSTPSRKDAYFGEGVYMTSIPPDVGRHPILKNNYNDGVVGRNIRGRADCCIKFRTQDLKEVTRKAEQNNRDIWLIMKDIDLDEYGYWYFEERRSEIFVRQVLISRDKKVGYTTQNVPSTAESGM